MTPCSEGLYSYTVQSGDTLWFISRRFNVSPESIVAVNPGVNLNSMYSGQMICVPREDGIQPSPSQEMPARPSTQVPTQPQLRTSPQPQSQRSQIQSQIQQQTPSMVRTESNSTDMVNTCPAGTYSYVIQSGDTLWLLSQRFGTTVDAIMSANPGINPMNLFIGQVICIPYGGIYPLPPQPQPQPQPQPRLEPVPRWVSSAEQTLNHYLRILWMQHIYWRRMLIQSIAFSSPNEDAVTNRLLQNLRDFKTALRPFYGEESGEQFEDLMTDRFTIGRELFRDIKAGNTSAADDAERRWYQNADRIAEFLGNLNPNWSVQDWKQMLYDDLAMLKVEASDMIYGDYNDSIYVFENIEQEAMKMADLMSWGIVRQFHQYFGL
ncbi:LysM peptidoglycan-binding domain-containing protein [Lacrimispora sp.]|uniref:LysM peptidoglycan-binding domain-containing protein n=1 Tax=Lacrimispora sp. TaxID=2719234 RepID=UPI0034605F94